MRKILLALFHHKTLSRLRFDLVLLKNRILHGAVFRSAAGVKPGAKYLNISCGPNGRASADWCNTDAFPMPGVDLVCDAARPFPFANRRFQGIFCEHFFGFLDTAEAKRFLAECLRMLRPGGTLRLSVPDGELYFRKYFDDRPWMLQRRGGQFRTPMEVVNEVVRQGFDPYCCFDWETLSLWLKEAGFANVTRADFGAGFDQGLLLDQENRRFESLYVEAQCPVGPDSAASR